MFEQKIIDNDDERFPGQVLIAGYVDGVEVWRSWMTDNIDPAIRLNPDTPIAVDERTDTATTKIEYREPTEDEQMILDGASR